MADSAVPLRLPLTQFSISASSVIDHTGKVPDELKNLYSSEDMWSRYGNTHTPVYVTLTGPATGSSEAKSDLIVCLGAQNTRIWDLDLRPCLLTEFAEQYQSEPLKLSIIFSGDGVGIKVQKRYSAAQPRWREVVKVALSFLSESDMQRFISRVKSVLVGTATGHIPKCVTIRGAPVPLAASQAPSINNSNVRLELPVDAVSLPSYVHFNNFSQLPDSAFPQSQASREAVNIDSAPPLYPRVAQANSLQKDGLAQHINISEIGPASFSGFDDGYQHFGAMAAPSSVIPNPLGASHPHEHPSSSFPPSGANHNEAISNHPPGHADGLAALPASVSQLSSASKAKAKPKASAVKRAVTKPAAAARKNIKSDASGSQPAVKKPKKVAIDSTTPVGALNAMEPAQQSSAEHFQLQSAQFSQQVAGTAAVLPTLNIPVPQTTSQSTPQPPHQPTGPLLNAQYTLAAMQAMNFNNLMQLGAAHAQQMTWPATAQAMCSGPAGVQIPFWPQPGLPYIASNAQAQVPWVAGQYSLAGPPSSGGTSAQMHTQAIQSQVAAGPLTAPKFAVGNEIHAEQGARPAITSPVKDMPQELSELASLLAAVNAGNLVSDVSVDENRARISKMVDNICYALYPEVSLETGTTSTDGDISGILGTLSSDEEKQLLLKIVLNDRDDFAGFVERVAQIT